MSLSPRLTLSQCLLLALNLLCLLLSLVALAYGTQKLINSYQTPPTTPEGPTILGTSESALGLALLLIGTLGATFALTGLLAALLDEAPCLTTSYVFLLLILICTVLGFALTNWLFTDRLLQAGRSYLYRSLRMGAPSPGRHPPGRHPSGNHSVNLLQALQESLHCCGVKSPADWHNADLVGSAWHQAHGSYPRSCCPALHNQSALCRQPYVDGCLSPGQVAWYQLFGATLVGVILLVLSLHLTLTCCLISDRKRAQLDEPSCQNMGHLKEGKDFEKENEKKIEK